MFFMKPMFDKEQTKQTEPQKIVSLDDVRQEHEAIYGDMAIINTVTELHGLRDQDYDLAR